MLGLYGNSYLTFPARYSSFLLSTVSDRVCTLLGQLMRLLGWLFTAQGHSFDGMMHPRSFHAPPNLPSILLTSCGSIQTSWESIPSYCLANIRNRYVELILKELLTDPNFRRNFNSRIPILRAINLLPNPDQIFAPITHRCLRRWAILRSSALGLSQTLPEAEIW